MDKRDILNTGSPMRHGRRLSYVSKLLLETGFKSRFQLLAFSKQTGRLSSFSTDYFETGFQ